MGLAQCSCLQYPPAKLKGNSRLQPGDLALIVSAGDRIHTKVFLTPSTSPTTAPARFQKVPLPLSVSCCFSIHGHSSHIDTGPTFHRHPASSSHPMFLQELSTAQFLSPILPSCSWLWLCLQRLQRLCPPTSWLPSTSSTFTPPPTRPSP